MEHSANPSPFPALLSEEYRQLNLELHSREPSYGTTARRYVGRIRDLATQYGAGQLLDYGCGKEELRKALENEFAVRSYDPAIPGLEPPPEPADLVACIDVLEHVELEYLENVLADLARVTKKVALITIATGPSAKRLADGSNPHRIVEPPSWWLKQLEKYFHVLKAEVPHQHGGLEVICGALSK